MESAPGSFEIWDVSFSDLLISYGGGWGLGATTFSKMTYVLTTLSTTTIGVITLITMKLSMTIKMRQSALHYVKCRYDDCRHAECPPAECCGAWAG
jgi:hypothetical protein